MQIRTAKGTFRAATFAQLAAWQAEMQGAFAAIEIGDYSVDVDGAETADDMALIIRAELADAFRRLADEAALVGDDEMAALALEAMDTGTVRAVEACCEAICAAADARN